MAWIDQPAIMMVGNYHPAIIMSSYPLMLSDQLLGCARNYSSGSCSSIYLLLIMPFFMCWSFVLSPPPPALAFLNSLEFNLTPTHTSINCLPLQEGGRMNLLELSGYTFLILCFSWGCWSWFLLALFR